MIFFIFSRLVVFRRSYFIKAIKWKLFSCVCIARYKHSRGWENSRRLCKRSTSSWVCITVSNSPIPFRIYIRLCKHGKLFLLLKYKSLQVSVSKYFRILPNRFNIQVTLLEMLLIYSCQSIEAKYFTVFDSSRSWPKKNGIFACK